GQMFASLNCGYGVSSHLTILDTSTGALTDLGRVEMDYGNYVDASLPTDSMAGLAFYAAPPTGGPAPTTTAPPSGPTFRESTFAVGLALLVAGAGALYLGRLLRSPRVRRVGVVLLVVGVVALFVAFVF